PTGTAPRERPAYPAQLARSAPSAAELLPEEQGDHGLGVADGAVQRPAQGLRPVQRDRLELLAGLGGHVAGDQVLSQEKVRDLVEDAGGREEAVQLAPPAGAVAGLLGQLAGGGVLDRLPRLERGRPGRPQRLPPPPPP